MEGVLQVNSKKLFAIILSKMVSKVLVQVQFHTFQEYKPWNFSCNDIITRSY